jgi:flagellar biosynthesis protein FlhF
MRLKLYRAPSVAAAMARVRAELGADALILGTRRVAEGVEVTAALEPPETAPPSPPRPDPAILALTGWHGVPAPLAATIASAGLAEGLAAGLRFAPLNLGRGAPPLLVAGPPGAGKTLTVVRLATRLVLSGIPPLVVSADARRAGAAEQLAALTRLLGLAPEEADHPAAIARAVARRQSGAPVLIDLPGGDPFATEEREDLAALAAALAATLVAVIPAGLDPAEAADLAASYLEANATRSIASRVDCTRRLGSVLSASAVLPLAEIGVGPGAADGLAAATPDLLADLLARRLPPDIVPPLVQGRAA